MKKFLLVISLIVIAAVKGNAQECRTNNSCSNFGIQYPSGIFSTSSSSWSTVSSFMNASNWTLFSVTAGNTYEWTYCNTYTGVTASWDAQLTLYDYRTPPNAYFLCYSDDYCATNAPYISWTATFTGNVLILTSQYNCVANSGSPYNKLVWRQSASAGACANLTPYQPSGWDNKIVLSTVAGTNTSASTFYNNQIIYIDWAAINNGTCNITQTFYTKLYLDGVLQNTYSTAGLNSNFYTNLQDLTIGPLAAGSHTFQIIVDANGDVNESTEGDNSYSRTITVSSLCANLTPYQPSGWDNKIVLSTVAGTNTSASTFYNNQIIYIDWAAINNGTCNITQTFYTKLYLDGVLQNTYSTAGLNSNFYTYLQDLTIGPLAAGSHTFQIIVDANGDVNETNEGDNSYSQTITVSSLCTNLTPYQPSGWDNKIVLSTVAGTNTSASTFYNNQIIYIDWAAINNGTCNITQTFYTKLYLDGVLQNTYSTVGLNSNFYTYLQDLTIGPLAAGSHTFQIVVDANGDVNETNEGDNSYSRTITVTLGICIPASITTVFNGAKTIYTELYQLNTYRLKDNCQTATNRIRDWNGITEITSPTNSWTTQNQRFGGSVLWATKQSYNYFLNIHSRPSYDGSNGNVEGYVNAIINGSPDGAAMSFTGGNMYVGLGSSGMLNNSWCSLDIIAHEYTHAVTGLTLEYQGESGALNESFSDIFGEAIENNVLGNNDWLIGADRTDGYLRSMSNPKVRNTSNPYSVNQPNTYLGQYWYTGPGDFGGVHTNSGVQNYWFYLLCAGSNGTKQNDNGYFYNITGIGIEKARAIAYKTLTGGYLSYTSDYSDARQASIDATQYLANNNQYGIVQSDVDVVKSTWCAVGLGPCQSDLIVQTPQVSPSTITAGGNTNATFYIKNQGEGTANASTTAFWLSQNQVFDGSPTDTWLNDIAVTSLFSGQTSGLLSKQITIPSGTSSGTWYIMFGADAMDNNIESNENNNQVFIPITVICNTPAVVSVSGSGTFCNSATLNASGGSGGTIYWQGTTSNGTSTTNPSLSQTVTSSGTYYFRAFNGCFWGPQGSATVTIDNTIPSAVIVSGSGTFCNSATLTASGGNGGTIYWQGTTSNGTSTSSPSTSQVVTSSGTYYFRSFNSCGWGVQGSAIVTISTSSTNWIGTVSTAWENPANWSCGVPTSTTDVIIPIGALIVVSSNAHVKSLLANPTANITINTGFSLTIHN